MSAATLDLLLANESATLELGTQLGKIITAPMIIWLEGDLGMGKTTLTRGLLKSLGYQGAVKSPTYNLVESYPFSNYIIHHLDLYRFQEPQEWLDAGLDDLMTQNSILLIEWPHQGGEFTPCADINIKLTSVGKARQAFITPLTDSGRIALAKFII